MSKFIPLSVPNFEGNEKEYVNNAVISEWVSTGGSMVSEFEQKVAQYTGMPRAVACNSGTSGLHLALLCAGVSAGDEVIAPALTFIASINPIRYVNAQPVFVGCDDTLCMDPAAVRDFCQNNCKKENNRLINKKTGATVKAIMVVHIFGNMADMPAFVQIAREFNLVLIEDAAEAIGTYYTSGEFKGKMAGTIGDIGVYSFNGNKIITTGAGGMVVSNHEDWLEHAKHLSTQAKSDELQFFHDEVGYNYRLTNVQAALGLAQLEQLEKFIERKIDMHNFYFDQLNDKEGYKILGFCDGVRSNRWFYSLLIPNKEKRDDFIEQLKQKSIQVRPVWALINEQANYKENECYAMEKAVFYREHIINLPCSTSLIKEDAQYVVQSVLQLK